MSVYGQLGRKLEHRSDERIEVLTGPRCEWVRLLSDLNRVS